MHRCSSVFPHCRIFSEKPKFKNLRKTGCIKNTYPTFNDKKCSSYSTNASASLRELSESFLTSSSTFYVEQMYDTWKKDSSKVHASWSTFFRNLENGAPLGEGWVMPPTLATSHQFSSQPPARSSAVDTASSTSSVDVEKYINLYMLVRAYQVQGHYYAKLDPLELNHLSKPEELKIETYGFTESDLDREFSVGNLGIKSANGSMKLRDLISKLERIYCGTVGYEYMHIKNSKVSNWIRSRIEDFDPSEFNSEEKTMIFEKLVWATLFERFLGIKWFGQKRFGLDGGESLIPGLNALIHQSIKHGVENVVIGMAHRGRLNVLANIMHKRLSQIFSEFDRGTAVPDADRMEWGAYGDVKYHLGGSLKTQIEDLSVNIALLPNPSHLEAVNPVVEGKTRSKQFFKGQDSQRKVMPIQIHGDSSVMGQGVVYEVINFSGLDAYRTGGTIHIVINNQIGFTTDPKFSRSSYYCTESCKVRDMPIFHVNGDDPEALVRVMKISADYRAQFDSDVCIDILCYRFNGHNEGDEPFFTQPLMYKKVKAMIPAFEQYRSRLVSEGSISDSKCDEIIKLCNEEMEQAYRECKESGKVTKMNWLESRWSDMKSPSELCKTRPTHISREMFNSIGEVLCSTPKDFVLHNTLSRMYRARKAAFEQGKNFDWATAEALAFASLLIEGYHVRLTGQDCERGTFSHRHAVLTDQTSGELYVPLHHVPGAKQKFFVGNSSLSEYSCLGFEFGYAMESPNQLVCWEAQYGDFANGAQIVIDQFLSCGEIKWYRQNGLVLLLPHGYEGHGPEHSSARLERYLQLASHDSDEIETDNYKLLQRSNWAVVNITTPANYFHALRRQIHRDYRKPLVVMSPKYLLRLDLCKSNIEDFTTPSEYDGFQLVIGDQHDQLCSRNKVRKLVFCSGKIYYQLFKDRVSLNVNDVVLVRIEQLMPFPYADVIEAIEMYPNARVIFSQEEPKNMGAWSYVYFPLKRCLEHVRGNSEEPHFVGRNTSPSPAAGSPALHELESKAISANVFGQ